MSKKTAVLGKVLRRLRRYIPAVVVALLLAAVYVAASLYIPVLVGRAIDNIVDAGKVNFAAMSKELTAIAVCAALGGLAQWVMTLINNRITYSVTRDIRNEAFRHLQVLPLSYLDGRPQGDTVSRVVSDVDTFADGLLMGFTQLFTGLMTIIGTLVLMLVINWKIALAVILITPVSLIVAAVIAGRTHSLFALQAKIRGQQTGMIDETVGQIKVVQAFNHEEESLAKFDETNKQLEKASLKAIFVSSITQPGTRFVNGMAYAVVALVGAISVIGGGISIGSLTSFLNYANQYTKPFNEISGVVAELQNALACAGRVFELIEAPAQSVEPEKPEMPTEVHGGMQIRDLDFSYTADKPNFYILRKYRCRTHPPAALPQEKIQRRSDWPW